MATAADSRFGSDVSVADTSVNARGYVSDVSARVSGLSDTLSNLVLNEAGVMAAVSVVGLLCPVSAWVVSDALTE
jgi:hypothetical protein